MTDAFLAELRASAPPAPERLRARVETIAAREPQQVGWLARIQPRRALLVAAPTALAAMLAVAVAHGVFSAPSQHGDALTAATALRPERKALGSRGAAVPANPSFSVQAPHVVHGAGGSASTALAPNALQSLNGGTADKATATPPPAHGRAQDYRATLTVRLANVGRMSNAMKAAINATRAWGGYVVAAEYNVPGHNGDAQLEVRIPVQHVQAAVQRFSNLGTLAAQNVSIRDVQGTLDTYTRQLLALRERIAKLRVQLSHATTDADRAAIQLKIARATRAATGLRAEQAALARRASFATVTLTLTTRAAAAAAPAKQGRVERTLRDAASILALELAFGLYALIVVAPFALIALIAFLAARFTRRRADDRLLGST